MRLRCTRLQDTAGLAQQVAALASRATADTAHSSAFLDCLAPSPSSKHTGTQHAPLATATPGQPFDVLRNRHVLYPQPPPAVVECLGPGNPYTITTRQNTTKHDSARAILSQRSPYLSWLAVQSTAAACAPAPTPMRTHTQNQSRAADTSRVLATVANPHLCPKRPCSRVCPIHKQSSCT